MYYVGFQLDSFEHLPDQAACAMMRTLVEALAGVDEAFIMNRRVPRLYDSGVRYSNPPKVGSKNPQPWRDVPLLLASGHGTCHELSAWRLAELRYFYGEKNVVPCVTSKVMGDIRMFHVQVCDPVKGWVEDPSEVLGMGSNPWEAFK